MSTTPSRLPSKAMRLPSGENIGLEHSKMSSNLIVFLILPFSASMISSGHLFSLRTKTAI